MFNLFMIPLLAAALLSTHGGHVADTPACEPSANPTPTLGQDFSLAQGRHATFSPAGLRIEFVRVLNDSRCPTDVQCIRAGNAKVAIKVTQPPAQATMLELNTNQRFDTRSTFRSYRVELMDLLPHPESGQTPKGTAYCAVLKISKAKAPGA